MLYFNKMEVKMKLMSLLCIGTALAVILLGFITKYVFPLAAAKPASYLQLAQILLLIGINFTLFELIKK